MKMNPDLHAHYRQLLGLSEGWNVVEVNLDLAAKQVALRLGWEKGRHGACSKCGVLSVGYDHLEERTWQHLNTMQFKTIITAQVPRIDCKQDGVTAMQVPWADAKSGFTKLFESFAVDVLQASQSVDAAADLLGLSWDQVHGIMERAVRRGLKRRSVEEVRRVGLDEKSFMRGQSYISLLNDLDGARVLEVAIGRDEAATEWLWDSLSEEQRRRIEAVAMDMAGAFKKVTEKAAPQADIVHDKFHIVGHLNDSVNEVRRAEHKNLMTRGDDTLKGARWLFVMNSLKMNPQQQAAFAELKFAALHTSRAWAIKELFLTFWCYRYEGSARKFFQKWFGWAGRCRLKPVIKVARMIKKHFENILTYLKHPITNAVSEGLNSKIQTLKANARGFRNFANYRIRILFYCGKLDLYPA
jgi:transposase